MGLLIFPDCLGNWGTVNQHSVALSVGNYTSPFPVSPKEVFQKASMR
jgi:hypothetical protein